jgi:predicted alpha/beta-fold hydrolase
MAHESGWDVVTFVYPGTDLSPITSPRFLRSIDTHDIDLVTSHLRKLHPNATIGAVGWSMGGCMLVRHLGTHGTNTPVSFAVCASNPFSPARSRASLTRHRLIYNLHYMDSLRDMFKVNSKVFAEHLPDLDVERILKVCCASAK